MTPAQIRELFEGVLAASSNEEWLIFTSSLYREWLAHDDLTPDDRAWMQQQVAEAERDLRLYALHDAGRTDNMTPDERNQLRTLLWARQLRNERRTNPNPTN